MRSQVQQNRSIEAFLRNRWLGTWLAEKQDSTTLLCMSGIKIPVIILGRTFRGWIKGIESWKVHQADVRAVCYDGLSGKINMVSGGPTLPAVLYGKSKTIMKQKAMEYVS